MFKDKKTLPHVKFLREAQLTKFERQLETMSARQQRIIHLMAFGGYSNKELSELLGVTISTIKFHVHSILKRLDLHSCRELLSMKCYFSENDNDEN
ncbi:MAG: response regulator transcription factor [Bdellovibrionales bacterium]|nr:response regulator transcription factor [Bdellovibrionales bacterium]